MWSPTRPDPRNSLPGCAKSRSSLGLCLGGPSGLAGMHTAERMLGMQDAVDILPVVRNTSNVMRSCLHWGWWVCRSMMLQSGVLAAWLWETSHTSISTTIDQYNVRDTHRLSNDSPRSGDAPITGDLHG